MMEYINEVLSHHIITPDSFKFVASSGVREAIQDGIVVLEMSFDIRMAEYYPDELVGAQVFLEALVEQYGTQVVCVHSVFRGHMLTSWWRWRRSRFSRIRGISIN